LAFAKRVSKESIEFMIEVFVELGFLQVSLETKEIILLQSPVRRELQESLTYQRKQEEMLLETELLYSSYDILCNYLFKGKLTIN
jgi:single-stranded-DNA-specific exonuclease